MPVFILRCLRNMLFFFCLLVMICFALFVHTPLYVSCNMCFNLSSMITYVAAENLRVSGRNYQWIEHGSIKCSYGIARILG